MTTKAPPKLLTREDILAAEDRAAEYVAVPEWGGTVRVIALTGTERGLYEASLTTFRSNGKGGLEMAPGNVANSKVRLAALSIVGEDDKRLFAEADILALGDKSSAALERVVEVAMRLSAFSPADMEALKEGLKGDRNGSGGSD
jgi:hypothetical protein